MKLCPYFTGLDGKVILYSKSPPSASDQKGECILEGARVSRLDDVLTITAPEKRNCLVAEAPTQEEVDEQKFLCTWELLLLNQAIMWEKAIEKEIGRANIEALRKATRVPEVITVVRLYYFVFSHEMFLS